MSPPGLQGRRFAAVINRTRRRGRVVVYVTSECFAHPKTRAFWLGGVSGSGQLSEDRRAQARTRKCSPPVGAAVLRSFAAQIIRRWPRKASPRVAACWRVGTGVLGKWRQQVVKDGMSRRRNFFHSLCRGRGGQEEVLLTACNK